MDGAGDRIGRAALLRRSAPACLPRPERAPVAPASAPLLVGVIANGRSHRNLSTACGSITGRRRLWSTETFEALEATLRD